MRRAMQALAQMAPVAVVRQPRMKEGIVDQLRRLILEGKLAPGTVLRQEHLARQLEVSRTPLREALVALEREGIIVVGPTGAASVVSFDGRDAREIMDIRELVDGLAARVLAERGLSSDVNRELTGLAKEMRSTAGRDKHRYRVLNADFHAKIVEASGHARLQHFIPLVRMSSQVVYMRLRSQGRALASAANDHAGILDAIRSGDGEAAEQLARQHVRAAARLWLT